MAMPRSVMVSSSETLCRRRRLKLPPLLQGLGGGRPQSSEQPLLLPWLRMDAVPRSSSPSKPEPPAPSLEFNVLVCMRPRPPSPQQGSIRAPLPHSGLAFKAGGAGGGGGVGDTEDGVGAWGAHQTVIRRGPAL